MKRGFTFIELMIVVCIIAIMSAIAVPVLIRSQQKKQQIPPAAIVLQNNQYVSMFDTRDEFKGWLEANKWNISIQSVAFDDYKYIVVFTQMAVPAEKKP